MWSSFTTLLIVSINLCTIIHSYKIANAENSKTLIEAYDEQDFQPRYDKHDSIEESSELQSTGRVVIGKWRNNGGALEPKWRDGDSVPLAPFSSVSFRNGWEKDTDSMEDDYHGETVLTSIEEKINKNLNDPKLKGEENSDEYRNENDKSIGHTINFGKIISTVGNNDDLENKPGVRRLSSSFRYRDRNFNKNTKSQVKHRETLDNYPMEYELFESDENDPKPRKRRPPELISGPWIIIGNEGKDRAENNPVRNVTTKSDDSFDLKKFLRMQNGELSLSEILQEKNLTLADILRGKPNAISILKSDNNGPKSMDKKKDEMITTKENFERNSTNGEEKMVSLPRRKIEILKFDGKSNLNVESKSIPSNYSSTDDKDKIFLTKSNESLNINLSLDGNSREKNKFKDLEKRLGKPFDNSGVSKDLETGYKNNSEVPIEKENDEDEIMEYSDYPMKMSKFVAPFYETGIIRSKLDERKIFPSSAIQETDNDKTNTGSVLKSDSFNGSKIVNEIVSKIVNEKSENFENDKITEVGVTDYSQSEVKVLEETAKEEDSKKPHQMEIISNDEVTNLTKDTMREEYLKDDIKISSDKNQTLNNKLRDVVIQKIDPQSRAEILELFSSGSSAERLERLLASRNMSIEELIALRQRGSSQVHFAQVYEAKGQKQTPEKNSDHDQAVNKKEESNKTEERSEKKIGDSDERKENFQSNSKIVNDSIEIMNNNNNDDDKKEDIFNADREYVATDLLDLFSRGDNIINNYSNSLINKKASEKIQPEIEDEKKNFLNKFDRVINSGASGEEDEEENVKKDSDGSSYYTSIETVKLPVIKDAKNIDKIDDKLSDEMGRVEEIFKNDIDSFNRDYNYSENKVLSKVRPSIIASGGILGVTIVVFLSIFIACRIRQKKKFHYKNSLAKTVFNNPVMSARKLSHTSSINSIMIEIAATSTAKRHDKRNGYESDEFEPKRDIDNDSLNANDSWETIPDFMK